jgi:DNA-binding CsgD family transcriptional regulator
MIVTKDIRSFSEQEWARIREHLGLPPRQAEILKCVMEGMSDKQVARATAISVNTVRTHMTRLFRKFGANDRVELIISMFGYLREHHLQDSHTSESGPATPEGMCPSLPKPHAQ